jgi:hypothetical protein
MIDPPNGPKKGVISNKRERIVTAGEMPTTLDCDFYALQDRMSRENHNRLATRGVISYILEGSMVKRGSPQG